MLSAEADFPVSYYISCTRNCLHLTLESLRVESTRNSKSTSNTPITQRPDFASVLETNQTWKKVRLFKNNELKRNRSSLSPELTNPNEHRVRFSKDNRTRPKRTKGSLISPCSLTFGERTHQKKAESGLEFPWFEVAVISSHENKFVARIPSNFGHYTAINGAFAQTTISW